MTPTEYWKPELDKAYALAAPDLSSRPDAQIVAALLIASQLVASKKARAG